ncbi:hybrid sensor histidine kinase/response regulator [Chondromyces apiculatus]|uniref:histidine kinase n=1 Tax=Chondromyces apiculatus DSM 436 TaxID=1192034 RepID=A0A017T0X4_9BACT|nr:ATP-binding protein [Chondromyces apiculatus]EYF02627.1 Hypothetical protein CAP_6657 [Chondromyces apiculatus DSM 436]
MRAPIDAATYGARMAKLQAVTARLAAVLDAEEVGTVLAREVWRALEPSMSVVYVVDEGMQALRMSGIIGLDAENAQRFAMVPFEMRTPVTEAYRARVPVTFLRASAYVEAYPHIEAGILASGFETFLALPLCIEDRALGVLALSWKRPEAIDVVSAEIARIAAQAGAMALQRVKLFASERAARARAEAARERLSVLAKVGEVLAGSLDYQRTIGGVVDLCVPRLADWAAVDMQNEDGTFSRLGVAHGNPVRLALAQELWERRPPSMEDPIGIPAVMRSGKAEVVFEITEATLKTWISDPELRESYARFGFRSSICLPLRVRGRSVGALTLLMAESNRQFVQEDVSLAQEVARRASLAIERSHSFREAQELSRHKDEFLATVSHELRTPLNAIVGWTRMLLGGRLPPERERHALEVIARNADLQTQLISDLLDVSRAISGKLRLEVGVVEMPAVLSAALESVGPAATARGVELALEVLPLGEGPLGEGRLQVAGDAGRLQQVMWNLLTNAIKFSPVGSKVTTQLRAEEDWIEVKVVDQGEGMPTAFLPHVFQQFRQADATRARKHGGLGLGLAICRTLVELHGGTIGVASEGQGKGSTFTVRLPVAGKRGDARPATPALQPSAPAPDATPPSTALNGARVLVVEDEPDARELLATLFEQHGAIVRAAGNAREAFEALPAFTPTLIVSDLGMPGEDGLSLIRRIRALPPEDGGSTPAVALTAFAREHERGEALAAGFQSHVSKPVDPEKLVAHLCRMLRRA